MIKVRTASNCLLLAGRQTVEIDRVGLVVNRVSTVISNTVPSSFAPPPEVVSNRSPLASAIRLASGPVPIATVEADQGGQSGCHRRSKLLDMLP